MRKKNEELLKQLKNSRKIIERERNKRLKTPQTPRSKTEYLMKQAGLNSKKREFEPIKKKLLYAECVSNEIKAASDKNPKKKNVIGRVVSGRIMKKYRLLTELKRATHIKRNSVNNHSKELTKTTKEPFASQIGCQRHRIVSL